MLIIKGFSDFFGAPQTLPAGRIRPRFPACVLLVRMRSCRSPFPESLAHGAASSRDPADRHRLDHRQASVCLPIKRLRATGAGGLGVARSFATGFRSCGETTRSVYSIEAERIRSGRSANIWRLRNVWRQPALGRTVSDYFGDVPELLAGRTAPHGSARVAGAFLISDAAL